MPGRRLGVALRFLVLCHNAGCPDEAVSASLQSVLLDAAIDGSPGRPLPTLVVRQAIFRYYPAKFVDGVLRHDVHRRHANAWDESDAVERDGEAVPILHVFPDELLQELRLLRCTFMIAKGMLSFVAIAGGGRKFAGGPTSV